MPFAATKSGVAALVCCSFLTLLPGTARAGLLVSSVGPSDVFQYDANGGSLGSFLGSANASLLSAPAAIVFDAHGNLLIADGGANNVWQFNPTSQILSTFVAPGLGGLSGPNGLAFDSAGNLYVASSGNGAVFEYDRSGNLLNGGPFVAQGTNGLTTPTGLAFDSAGNLYVADAGGGPGTSSGQVLEFNNAGGLVATINAPGVNGLDAATALAFDTHGNLYAANATAGAGNSSVLEYDSSGNFIATFASGLTGPTALVFDSLGDLFVADAGPSTNSVIEFDGGGNLLGTFIGPGVGGLGAPEGLSLDQPPAPVPEPSTLLMFATAAVFAAGRRVWRGFLKASRLSPLATSFSWWLRLPNKPLGQPALAGLPSPSGIPRRKAVPHLVQQWLKPDQAG